LTSPARQIIEQEFGQAGMMTPANLVECTSIFATLQLLQKSDAVTMLPESVVRDHLQAGLLVRLPLNVGKSLPGFGILTRRSEPLTAAGAELVESLRRYGSLLVQATPGETEISSKRLRRKGRTLN
jgi:DNA-binding transcriptional LysR family regulator